MNLTLAEWEQAKGVVLSDLQVRALVDSNAVDIRPDAPALGTWNLQPRSHVGVLAVEGLELRIRPKVPVRRLLALICESIGRVDWHETDTTWAATEDLLGAVAGSFCTQSERALAPGVLQGYQTIDDTIFGVKGRINLPVQLSRRAGLALPVEVTFDAYTIDVLENRLLAGAAVHLLKLPLPPTLRARLRRLLAVLVEVSPEPAQPSPPEPAYSRLNLRYRPAVTLARLVLRSSSIEEDDDRHIRGSGLLVDMNQIFEDAVGRGLAQATRGGDLSVKLQHEDHLDAEGHLKQITPDVAWLRDGRVCAIADIKYKRPSLHGVGNADIYQVLAYATRYRLTEVHLIYADPPPIDLLRVSGTTVLLHHVDLDSDRDDREQQFAEIATAVLSA